MEIFSSLIVIIFMLWIGKIFYKIFIKPSIYEAQFKGQFPIKTKPKEPYKNVFKK